MWIDVVGLIVLLLFAGLGAWRGALATGAGLVSMAVGYAAAVFAAGRWGGPAAEAAGLPALAGPPLAGTAAFAVSYLVCGGVTAVLKAWERRRRGELPRGRGDRIAGAVFGGMRGALVVLLLGWVAIWLDAGRQLSAGERFAAMPETSSSVVAKTTGVVVEKAVEAALADRGGALAGRMAAHPAETVKGMQVLLDDERIQAVQRDRLFWTYVEKGAVQNALNRRSFWNVVNDDELRGTLAELGMIDAAAAEDPGLFRDAAAEMLTELGPRLEGLDAELQELARDPEIAALVESGDTMGLLGHPAIQRVVARVSSP